MNGGAYAHIPKILSKLGCFFMITIFMDSGLISHAFWKCLGVVSARFTARSIIIEMSTGNRSRVA